MISAINQNKLSIPSMSEMLVRMACLKMIKINAFEQNFTLSLKTLLKFFVKLNDISL